MFLYEEGNVKKREAQSYSVHHNRVLCASLFSYYFA